MAERPNFNPLPPCGGRHTFRRRSEKRQNISIHSLRVEGDAFFVFLCQPHSISIHSLRVEGDYHKRSRASRVSAFQSTPSVWRETFYTRPNYHKQSISIHSLRVEGDSYRIFVKGAGMYFNPLPPCGGRQQHFLREKRLEHFNPLPPCGGRPDTGQISNTSAGISIHSLRVEGDNDSDTVPYFVVYFNPLPPCGGRHTMYNTGATLQHFNPLPPCGGRLLGHALHTGIEKFQSTPSVWRETKCKVRIQAEKLISIHSLRVEGDIYMGLQVLNQIQFQSTPSVWRETKFNTLPHLQKGFQSTPSVWRETFSLRRMFGDRRFQSTPSVWRETRLERQNAKADILFQSTPSVWRETDRLCLFLARQTISIHSLRVEGDNRHESVAVWQRISIHSLRVEGDCSGMITRWHSIYFNPLPPCGGRRIV